MLLIQKKNNQLIIYKTTQLSTYKQDNQQLVMQFSPKNPYHLQTKISQKFPNGKIISPPQMLNLLKKNQHNRIWILKQLSQLDIDISILQNYTLNDLYRHCEQIIKSTYSIKYLGMNQNQMGIISRRIDPFKDNNFNLKSLIQSSYTVNKFFFPKPLKVGRKPRKLEDINTDNLEFQIKKAFLKNNPNYQKNKIKYGNGKLSCKNFKVTGSWMNQVTKIKARKCKQLQQFEQGKENDIKFNSKQKTKSFSQSKYLNSTNCNLSMSKNYTQANITSNSNRKLACSYSRFLSNGLIFNDSCSEQKLKPKQQ